MHRQTRLTTPAETSNTAPALRVRDLMTAEPLSLGPSDSLARLYDLMSSANVRHVPVVEQGQLVGLVTHRDLLRCALGREPDLPRSVQQEILRRLKVGEIMTSDVEAAEPDWDIRIAAQLMLENKYGCLPVTEGTRLVGILSRPARTPPGGSPWTGLRAAARLRRPAASCRRSGDSRPAISFEHPCANPARPSAADCAFRFDGSGACGACESESKSPGNTMAYRARAELTGRFCGRIWRADCTQFDRDQNRSGPCSIRSCG
jgi:CBS domain-containing membrane protein